VKGTLPMKLYPLYAMGIKAYCSDIIVDAYETAYFMSICGYQTTVKGIIANFLEHNGISLEIEKNKYYLNRTYLSYKSQIKKLPSGLVHALLFPKLALPKNDEERQNSFLIFTDQDNEILSLFFRHLDEKTEIPLHPSWDSWLWQVFTNQENWIVEMNTLVGNFKGYMFEFNPQKLQDLLFEAIKNKEPEIINCMKIKGDNNNEFNFS